MFKSSVIYLIYDKAKGYVIKVLNILKTAADGSYAVYFLMYPKSVEESAAYMVLSIPSKTLEGYAKKTKDLKEYVKNSSIYKLLRDPLGLPLSFLSPFTAGLCPISIRRIVTNSSRSAFLCVTRSNMP